LASFDHLLLAAMNRPRDVSFALTQILARSHTKGDLLHGLVNADAVSAAGHSLGGYAAMTLAGGDDDVCDATYAAALVGFMGPPPGEACLRSEPDPRIRAIVYFDGTNHLLRARELSRITVPALGVGRGQDGLALPPWLPWNARPHAAIASRHSFRVDLNQTIHVSFANACQNVPIWRRHGVIDEATAQLLLSVNCSSPNPLLQGGMLRSPLETLQLATEYAIAFLKSHAAGGDDERSSILRPGWGTARNANIEFFCTERGGDTFAGPAEQSAYLDPSWGESFRYFAHQPKGVVCEDAN
jgi:predicted dienelactone hydrolase